VRNTRRLLMYGSALVCLLSFAVPYLRGITPVMIMLSVTIAADNFLSAHMFAAVTDLFPEHQVGRAAGLMGMAGGWADCYFRCSPAFSSTASPNTACILSGRAHAFGGHGCALRGRPQIPPSRSARTRGSIVLARKDSMPTLTRRDALKLLAAQAAVRSLPAESTDWISLFDGHFAARMAGPRSREWVQKPQMARLSYTRSFAPLLHRLIRSNRLQEFRIQRRSHDAIGR